jgi:hypothetical protein
LAARGYTTVALVAQELAQDLTAPQLDQCADLIAVAEAEVDRETGRSWLTTSPVTNELHTVSGPVVYLTHRPVTAVTSVTIRSLGVGSQPQTLTAGSGYELIDAANGAILLAGYGYPHDIVINTERTSYDGYLLSVSYTHALTAINPAIQKITTEIVAAWMSGRISGTDTAGIKRYSLPDLTVEYSDDASSGTEIPSDLLRRLKAFSRIVFA